MKVDVTVTCDTPYPHQAMRFATIRIGGVEIYNAIVYDTDGNGKRTEEQAVKNALRTFGDQLRKVLDS